MSAADVTWIAIWVVLVSLAVMNVRTRMDARDRWEVPHQATAWTIACGVLVGLLALLVILLSLPVLTPLAANLEIVLARHP